MQISRALSETIVVAMPCTNWRLGIRLRPEIEGRSLGVDGIEGVHLGIEGGTPWD